MPTEIDELLQKLRDDQDDYRGSVWGLCAFAATARWDDDQRAIRPDSKWSIPRTMTPADDGDNVTPDLVVQVTDDYGVVAEMKKHFRPKDLTPFAQIRGYDRDLIGWWTEDRTIAMHDLAVLTHYFSSTRAEDAWKLWLEDHEPYDRSFAIVEFNFSTQGREYFSLKSVHGELSDSDYSERLRHAIPIPQDVFLDRIEPYQFYDGEPPLIHVLVVLQNYVLPNIFSESDFEFDTEKDEDAALEITVSDLCAETAKLCAPPEHEERWPQLPREQWIVDALNVLVKIGHAEALDEGGSSYRLYLRKPNRKDSLEFFGRKIARLRADGELDVRLHPQDEETQELPFSEDDPQDDSELP